MAAVEGLLAYRERRWSEAIAGLGPLARRGEPLQPGPEVVRRRCRWLMADAFEAIGQPDSAATYLESIVSRGPWSPPALTQRTLYEPFVRARLVDLAIARGRRDEARAQWEAMLRVLTRPDDRARRLIEETRARLQVAGALGSTPSR